MPGSCLQDFRRRVFEVRVTLDHRARDPVALPDHGDRRRGNRAGLERPRQATYASGAERNTLGLLARALRGGQRRRRDAAQKINQRR
jgi:hypothetical protein